MKKVMMIVISMMILMPTMANAQLVKTSKTNTKTEKLCSMRMGVMNFYNMSNLYCVSIPSTNQFDDNGWFYLGEGKESAVATLNDLYELTYTLTEGESIRVQNRDKEVGIHKGMTGNLALFFDGLAGICYFHRSEIRKCLKTLGEEPIYKEQKTDEQLEDWNPNESDGN